MYKHIIAQMIIKMPVKINLTPDQEYTLNPFQSTAGKIMLAFLKNPAIFQILSIAGTLSAVLGSLIAAAAFRGRLGEAYSPFNHFISELGEVGVSRLAWVFNLGLILCGLCLLPACINLGLLLPGIWSKLGMAAGVIASVSVALVGVFPMNNLKPHTRAAMTYFRMGLLMVFFFCLAIALQPEVPPLLPRLFSLAGLPAVLAFAYFLIYMRVTTDASQDPLAPLETARPPVWGMAVAEWIVFLTTIPLFLVVALGL